MLENQNIEIGDSTLIKIYMEICVLIQNIHKIHPKKVAASKTQSFNIVKGSFLLIIKLFHFSAVCSPECESGGKCVEPGQCQCRPMFSGNFCQLPMYRRSAKRSKPLDDF